VLLGWLVLIVAQLKKKVYEKDFETDLLYQQISIYRDGLTMPAGPQSNEVKRRLIAKRKELDQLELQLKQVTNTPIAFP
jgi:hypothetical protein